MTFSIAIALLIVGAQVRSGTESGIAMVEMQSCQVAFVSEAINQGRWGGRIAVYDVSVATDGRASAIERQRIAKSEHMIQWVQLSQLEQCIREWRFAEPGNYQVSLTGGTIFGREWSIDLSSGNNARLRLRVPWPGVPQ
jgi:hypothetical protein